MVPKPKGAGGRAGSTAVRLCAPVLLHFWGSAPQVIPAVVPGPTQPLLPLRLAPLTPVTAAKEPGPLVGRVLLPVQTGKLLGEVLQVRAMARGSAPSPLTLS